MNRRLALVQREPYVWYQKGGQIMYTLADYIGEDKVNRALQNFLMQYRYANADNQVDAANSSHDAADRPYPDTRMLVDALYAQTPPKTCGTWWTTASTASSSTTTRPSTATSQKTADGKFKVTLNVQVAKCRPMATVWRSRMPLADYIDIGVFSGKKDDEKPLYMKREKLTQEHQTFTIVVDQQPTRAGIDPYNKLIDRISDDNTIDVTKQ